MDGALDAVVTMAADGVITAWNPNAEAIFGWPASDAVGRALAEMVIPPRYRARHAQGLAEFLATGEGPILNQRIEIEALHRSGHEFPVELTVIPIRQDRTWTFSAFVRDLTERRRAEREHRQLEDQLRQAQKMEAIGQLTGGIAHDLNNILSVILANAGLLADRLPAGRQDLGADVAEIQAASARGAAMVKKLLAFSRRETLMLAPANLNDVAGGLADTLRRLLPSTIDVTVACAEDLPWTRADVGAIEQVLFNLATNARDARPEGGMLRIETGEGRMDDDACAARGWGRPGTYACIVVRDSGVGMDAATRSRIFEPFFTTKPPGLGTGLGLSMVYGLVKQHDGFVSVQSEPRGGTTVTLYFPAVEAPALAERAPASTRAAGAGAETLLVVEDEEALRRVTARALEQHGYRVLVAADGAEALEVFHANRGRIALVLSDVVMPKLGGKELLARLRHDGVTCPFVLTSGYPARDARESITRAPDVPFIPKPWTPAELVAKIREALDGAAR